MHNGIPENVLIFSGGMDSATLLYYLLNREEMVQPLTFEYGSKHNYMENQAVAHVLRMASEIYGEDVVLPGIYVSLGFMGELIQSSLLKNGSKIPHGHYESENMKSTVVPNRNLSMLSVAIGLAESQKMDCVVFGAHGGDHAIYPDCREEFVKSLDKTSQLATFRKIKVSAPFIGMTKANIASMGHNLHVPYELTYSCYEGGEVHCGLCPTCGERREAFFKAGIKDPTVYAVSWEETKRICKIVG